MAIVDDRPVPPKPVVIDTGSCRFECGYCGRGEAWTVEAFNGMTLTGFTTLGVGPAGEVVVLVEGEFRGHAGHMVHQCAEIPDDVIAWALSPERN